VKKTFRQEDGSFVTIEGTAEEIRQYERIVENDRRGNEPKKQKPDVLKGLPETAEEVKKILERLGWEPKEKQPRPLPQPIVTPWIPPFPSWCLRCGGNPCVCHITYPSWPTYPQIWYRTTAGDSITLTGDTTMPSSRSIYEFHGG
jgi:hypothetical protein